jgi:capsular polysaccharide transport system ATP-binding protein
MIKFENVSKSYHIRKFQKQVFNDLSFTINRGESIGICGANGAGKSTLMRLISGIEEPSGGKIMRTMSTSWPIGYSNTFVGSLTGADNARFIARIYGKDEKDILAFVEEFAQLGPYFNQPIFSYSAGMNARLAFGVSLAIEFECYLIDEVTGAGDERFRERTERELAARREQATLIMVSHDPNALLQYCDRGAVLYGGNLTFYDTIADAIDVHHRLQTRKVG